MLALRVLESTSSSYSHPSMTENRGIEDWPSSRYVLATPTFHQSNVSMNIDVCVVESPQDIRGRVFAGGCSSIFSSILGMHAGVRSM